MINLQLLQLGVAAFVGVTPLDPIVEKSEVTSTGHLAAYRLTPELLASLPPSINFYRPSLDHGICVLQSYSGLFPSEQDLISKAWKDLGMKICARKRRDYDRNSYDLSKTLLPVSSLWWALTYKKAQC